MKSTLLFIGLVLATAVAFYIVWMNRASEKIVTAVIPIAVAALVGIYLAVFVFGGLPPISEKFPSSHMYRIKDKIPASAGLPRVLWWRRFTSSLFAPAQLARSHPERFNDQNDENGATLYHHLLQKAIIDWMGMRYRATWEIEILNLDLPTAVVQQFQPAVDATEPSVTLSTEQIDKLLQGNIFAGIHTGIPPKLALPPGTQLKIRAPHREKAGWELGEIILKNNFCNLSIQTRYSSWQRGVGSYKRLAGLSDEDDQLLATATYIVTINTTFSRFRSGHPDMPKYESWARQMANELRKQFDEEIIWLRTKEDYLFTQQVRQLGAAE